MIDWKNYKKQILALDDAGLSSSKIISVLSQINEEIKPTDDRTVRRLLTKWTTKVGEVRKPVKVLLFDIEVAPLISYVWNKRQRFIPQEMIIKEWYMLSWSAKYLLEDGIIHDCVTPQESLNRDDKRIVKSLWKLIDESDVVIAHNGDNYDIRKINGRFAKYGLYLPSPYQTIDTLKTSRKTLSLPAYNLDYIAEYFGLPKKKKTDFELWAKCMLGDQKSLNYMDEYCQQDIRVLEDVYLNLRPYIRPHPNLGLNIDADSEVCPTCGSTHLHKDGEYHTTVNVYDAFRCEDCGSLTRSRNSKLSREQRKTITSSIPR